MNAMPFVVGSNLVFAIAYRSYFSFIATEQSELSEAQSSLYRFSRLCKIQILKEPLNPLTA